MGISIAQAPWITWEHLYWFICLAMLAIAAAEWLRQVWEQADTSPPDFYGPPPIPLREAADNPGLHAMGDECEALCRQSEATRSLAEIEEFERGLVAAQTAMQKQPMKAEKAAPKKRKAATVTPITRKKALRKASQR